jgi:zinc protease
MKTRRIIIGIFLILILTVPIQLRSQKDPRQLTYSAIRFTPPEPNHISIKKGVDVYYLENPEIPLVKVDILFKLGGLHEPAGKEGLASMTFQMLKNGGTKNLEPGVINEKLDFLGTSISVQSAAEYSIISLVSLKKNFRESWDVLQEMLFRPIFDEQRLMDEKGMTGESNRRVWDSAVNIGFILFNQLVYGKNAPDSRRPTTKSIAAVSREDVISFYNDCIKKSELMIGISGDFEPRVMRKLVKKSFRKWKASPPKAPIQTGRIQASKPGVYFLHRDNLSQAVICMGHLGINRLDKDKAEINVLNFIYGQNSFNSRLGKELRAKRGLAYTVFGNVGKGRERGLFQNFCMTNNGSVAKAIRVIEETMRDITENRISREELKTALEYEENSFVHLYDVPRKIILWKIIYKMFGYPDDYLETYLQRIRKLDEQKVMEMAKRTMHPDQLVIVVVGDKNTVYPHLNGLGRGEITELHLEQVER